MSFFRFLLLRKFSEIALWLRISGVSQPQKNPLNLQGEFGGRILAISEKSTNSQSTFHSTKKTKACSKKILPFKGAGTGEGHNRLFSPKTPPGIFFGISFGDWRVSWYSVEK
jgi:hypothetical protein